MRAERVDLYIDAAGKWRWRYVAANGRILADSGQGYRRQPDAIHGLELVLNAWFSNETYGPEVLRRTVPGPPIEVRVQP